MDERSGRSPRTVAAASSANGNNRLTAETPLIRCYGFPNTGKAVSSFGSASREMMALVGMLIAGVASLTNQTEQHAGSARGKRETLPHERNVVIKHSPAHPQLRPSELLRQKRQR